MGLNFILLFFITNGKNSLSKASTLVADGIHHVHFAIGGRSCGLGGKSRHDTKLCSFVIRDLNWLFSILQARPIQICHGKSHRKAETGAWISGCPEPGRQRPAQINSSWKWAFCVAFSKNGHWKNVCPRNKQIFTHCLNQWTRQWWSWSCRVAIWRNRCANITYVVMLRNCGLWNNSDCRQRQKDSHFEPHQTWVRSKLPSQQKGKVLFPVVRLAREAKFAAVGWSSTLHKLHTLHIIVLSK